MSRKKHRDPWAHALIAPRVRFPRCPCGKVIYDNEASAKLAADRMPVNKMSPMVPYLDPRCEQWHLTSKPTPEQRINREAS